MNPDFLFGITDGDIIFDIETYPNLFCIGLQHVKTGQRWYFEISPNRNDIQLFVKFLSILSNHNCRMVGFNNVGFDYPIIHMLFKNSTVGIGNKEIYEKCKSIIGSFGPGRFAHMVWDNDHVVPQIDLFKIHHFDNMAKTTSLKMLEFNMRMNSIQDLPFPPGTVLTEEQRKIVADYMWHDVKATEDFYHETADQIVMREGLSKSFNINMMNMNNGKIGESILIRKMEDSGIECFEIVGNSKVKRQTPMTSIDLADTLFPYVKLEHEAFKEVQKWINQKTINETKGVFNDIKVDASFAKHMNSKIIKVLLPGEDKYKKLSDNPELLSVKDAVFISGTGQKKSGLNCIIDGFQYDFGTGGIHGSVESQIIHSTDAMVIEDWDVASYYPNLGIKNRIFPKHLGESFCDIYYDIYLERKKHKKGTSENIAFKEALNVPYGKSNSKYSVLLDPFYTMSITINGQLSLCMLAEQLIKLGSLRMIQINTDGLTITYPRQFKPWVHEVCQWWETVTKLTLENAEYSRMMIRDVNNYIAEYTDGKLKRKGAYEYDLGWHQNHSALVVPKAAEAALVRGEDIREFITNHTDMFDFFLRTKVPRNSTLKWGEETVQNITRYYISTDGDTLKKVMPPAGPLGEFKRANSLTDSFYNDVLAEIGSGVWDERIHTKNKSKYEIRETNINTGWTVQICNDLDNLLVVQPDGENHMIDLNYEWYIKEVEKLVKPLMG